VKDTVVSMTEMLGMILTMPASALFLRMVPALKMLMGDADMARSSTWIWCNYGSMVVMICLKTI
jgi:hypothetical protein